MRARGSFSPRLWPHEVRFFPEIPSFSDPIQPSHLELPLGQMSAWASSHPGCGIFLCTGPGSVRVRIGHEEYLLHPGGILLVPPGAPFCWFAEKERSEILGVLFRHAEALADMAPEEMSAFFSTFNFGMKGGLSVSAPEKKITNLIEENLRKLLRDGVRARNGAGLRRKILLAEIILQILDESGQRTVQSKSEWREGDWGRLAGVVSYLQHHYHEELYAEQIQKILRLPKNYLAFTFPAIMGQRWNHYLLDYRIRRAALRLLQDKVRISSAALESGFSTLSHFNHSFRKVMRMSPRDFVSRGGVGGVTEEAGLLPPKTFERVGRMVRGAKGAFTLVELLVTITIIGLLAGLSIPVIKAARESGSQAACLSNLKQLTTAQLAAVADNDGKVIGRGWAHDANGNVTNGRLWQGGYVQNAKVFLCPHGRKQIPGWLGVPSCDYSINVTPKGSDQSNDLEFYANRIANPSKVILLLEEANPVAGDSCAFLDYLQSPFTGDRLFIEEPNYSNHRKKGCVSFYDGSVLAVNRTDWGNTLNTRAKRQTAYGTPQ